MIVILGPTATGKTTFAANLAHKFGGEIISADSRQVYRGMDLATGKDFNDYKVEGKNIPYHLINIVEPGYEYNVYEFQKDFIRVYNDIHSRGKTPVLCGGTGMYIESVIKGYKLYKVPENQTLRKNLEQKTDNELLKVFKSFKSPHNVSDTKDRKRLIRAIEIQSYYSEHRDIDNSFPKFNSIIIGILFKRDVIRERITSRLKTRMDEGMVEEVKSLLNKGLKPDQLKFYGLEYKFLTQYVTGEISREEMFRLLNIAIHQFAKRQMTWFRRMEKTGYEINWIDGELPMKKKVETALKLI